LEILQDTGHTNPTIQNSVRMTQIPD